MLLMCTLSECVCPNDEGHFWLKEVAGIGQWKSPFKKTFFESITWFGRCAVGCFICSFIRLFNKHGQTLVMRWRDKIS